METKNKITTKVTLTKTPTVTPKYSLSSGVLTQPIGIAYIAAALRREGYSVSIIDPVGENPFEINEIQISSLVSYGWSINKIVSAISADTRYVGISCMFSHEWPTSQLLAKKIRKRFPDAIIIAGGEHITAIPEFSFMDCPDINYAVLGEGEQTIVELINTLEQGDDVSSVNGLAYLKGAEVIRTEPRERIRHLESIAWPAWDLIPMENYLNNRLSFGVSPNKTIPIVATRGCPYQCSFCSAPNMWKKRWYARNPKDVVDEIETYVRRYSATNFDFFDLTPIFRKQWVIDFCQELAKRDLKITWQIPGGTRTEIIDDEIASLLASTGHRNLVYAPETGSEQTLKYVRKQVNLSSMLKSIRSAICNCISVKLNIVFGFPQDTQMDILRTYKFLVNAAWIGVDDVTISTFIPYPGSEFFTELVQTGKVKLFDKEYFHSLAVMSDIRSRASFSNKIGKYTLLAYRLFGMFLFYSFSYIFRPQRFFQTIWNIYKKEHKTRIEKALSTFIHKVFLYHCAGAQHCESQIKRPELPQKL